MPTSKRNSNLNNKDTKKDKTLKEKFSLKDHLFNKNKVQKLASEIKSVYSDFDEVNFTQDVLNEFPNLELKQRISHISNTLKKYFESNNLNYRDSVEVILRALPNELDATKSDDDFGDFIYAPYGEYIALFGTDEMDFDFSMKAIYEINKRFSCEFPIRVFINLNPDRSMEFLLKWSLDTNYHVRRLASEGSRPKLPWGQKVSLNYKDAELILDNLFSDKTRYVTRSVANHLHDISKIDKDFVISKLKSWMSTNRQDKQEMEYIVKHSLRSLIREGDKDVLKLLNISHTVDVEILNFQLKDKVIKIGEYLNFSFKLLNKIKKESLHVNYVIYFPGKDSQISKSKKIFKIKDIELNKNQEIIFSKKHLFRGDMTTRKIYKGKAKIEIQINGVSWIEQEFDLI